MAHNNISTSVEDVDITVTESLNESIFKSLSRIESSLNEVLLMMEHLPKADGVNDGTTDTVIIDPDTVDPQWLEDVWEDRMRSAVITSLRRHRNDPDGQIIVDTVIAIMKGHTDDN